MTRPYVMVLSTLHQFHEQVACYDLAALERIITTLAPDVMMLEVSSEDLEARADETVKIEYPRVVYPLIDALGIPAYPLEPSGVVGDELIRRKRAAEGPLRESPQYRAMESHWKQWLDDMFAGWASAADANSGRSDAAVIAKNQLLDQHYPPDYAQVWDEWNQYFLDRIVEVIDRSRPRLCLVLVGLEHSSWLRPRLAAYPGAELVDAERALRGLEM